MVRKHLQRFARDAFKDSKWPCGNLGGDVAALVGCAGNASQLLVRYAVIVRICAGEEKEDPPYRSLQHRGLDGFDEQQQFSLHVVSPVSFIGEVLEMSKETIPGRTASLSWEMQLESSPKRMAYRWTSGLYSRSVAQKISSV